MHYLKSCGCLTGVFIDQTDQIVQLDMYNLIVYQSHFDTAMSKKEKISIRLVDGKESKKKQRKTGKKPRSDDLGRI